MKNCNEVVNDLLERKKIYQKHQQQKRRMLVSVSCCLVMGLVLMTNGNEGNSHRLMPTIDIENDDRGRVPIYINEIKAIGSPTKLFFDPEKYDEKILNIQEISDYYGFDFTSLVFDRFDLDLDYGGKNSFKIIYSKDGSLAFDVNTFPYKNDRNQMVYLHISKLMTPNNVVYYSESVKETLFKTKYGGTYVTLGGMTSPMSDTLPNNSQIVYSRCVADFSQDGLNYHIEARNVKANEFNAIVQTVIYPQ